MVDIFREHEGNTVDLDDPKIYRHGNFKKLKTTHQMIEYLWAEIGKSIVYMDIFHPGDFKSQRPKVIAFAHILKIEKQYRWDDVDENRTFWRKLIYRFEDEVENQC